MKKIKVDIPFLISVIILSLAGFLIFSSASLGLLSKQASIYSDVATKQAVLGLGLGTIACICLAQFDYRKYKAYALPFFIGSIILTLLVFVPGIGWSHGGAKRWIGLRIISFQPSEILKIATIIYLATWFSNVKEKVSTMRYGLVPFGVIVSIVGVVLLLQPDTDTFAIIACAGLAMYFVSGGRWKHIGLLAGIGLLLLGGLILTRPYLLQRVMTFVNPATSARGAGYQIQQSFIALGSGGFAGRGFGQSIQKFNFLPEPIGDSIFAVAGEEFGFIGTVSLVLLFLFFCFRGLKIANKTSDQFGRLLVIGIVILITAQAFVNIGAMVGIIPLSGITLPFVSHGGTSLAMTLAMTGIVLNISKQQKK